MKKILTSMALISLCGAALQADELKFVTVLSQPIGAFAQVESLNEERASKTLFVNFCNTSVNTGKINAQGMVKMNELRLTGDTARAGSSTVKMNYQITEADGLEIGKGGSLSGGKLLANTANPQDITVAAGTNINAASTFVAADIPSMTIGGSTKIVYPAESLTGANVHWEATSDEYRYNFKVDKDKGVIKDGDTEYDSYPIRTDKRGGECRCGNVTSPFGKTDFHCTKEWGTQECSSQESPSERRVGTIFWRFNYENCQWYEADPKGYESTSNWDKWVKWGTIPSHHNCQCKGYSGGSYVDSSSSSFDQQYGNPNFKSGAISGNMVNESRATRSRSCRYDKIHGYGEKYDGTITGTYDFANCKWNETTDCYCSTTRADAPASPSSSTREVACSTHPKFGSEYSGTVTEKYDYSLCEWKEESNTCTKAQCCLYQLQNASDRVESGYRWDDIRIEDENLKYRESCSNYNQTQGASTAFNCTDNAGESCYDGYDYDCCGYTEDCNCHNIYQDTMNVFFHYKTCALKEKKPCSEVPADQLSHWVKC